MGSLLRRVVLVLLAGYAFAALPVVAQQAPSRVITRVLFVGNSLTSYNGMPAMAEALARAVWAQPLDVTVLADNGASLRDHLQSGRLSQALSAKNFDVVVLQELGGFPLCDPELERCRDAEGAMKEAVARARPTGARIVWYSTWQMTPPAQAALSKQVTARSRELRVELVDTGAAMQRWRSAGGENPLVADGHPSITGSWLIAVSIAQAIMHKPAAAPADAVSTCLAGGGAPCSTLTAVELAQMLRVVQ